MEGPRTGCDKCQLQVMVYNPEEQEQMLGSILFLFFAPLYCSRVQKFKKVKTFTAAFVFWVLLQQVVFQQLHPIK